MSMRLFAVLFTALFLVGALPILFIQYIGSAGTGITSGFTLSAQNPYQIVAFLAIGLLSAWYGGDAMLLLPLCSLLMLTIGSLMEIGESTHAMHVFIAGSIVLYGACVGVLHKRVLILWASLIAFFAYFTGGNLMRNMPDATMQLFFLLGIIISSSLVLAMGVTLGIALGDRVHTTLKKFRHSSACAAFSSFLSL
jgi:hydrogenase/urease accessory protein HupE